MMKRLWIIRHAKSDHGLQYKSDFERPLNKRGRRDAPLMAKHLKKATGKLDKILVSTAQRTRETAIPFMEEFDLNQNQIEYVDALYLPAEEEIWEVIRLVEDNLDDIALFSHNMAVEILLHRYRPGTEAPTCSVIELHFDGKHWYDIDPDDVRFISHTYPKLYV